jgi:hypothetical protein
MATFLEYAAVVGMKPLKAHERPERVGHATEAALADRYQVENVAVLGNFGEHGLRGRERLGELVLLQQRACAVNFGLDARCKRIWFSCCHERLPSKVWSPPREFRGQKNAAIVGRR